MEKYSHPYQCVLNTSLAHQINDTPRTFLSHTEKGSQSRNQICDPYLYKYQPTKDISIFY